MSSCNDWTERVFVVGLIVLLASCAVFSTTQTTKATTENLAQVFENGDNWVMITSEMSYLYDACLYFHLDVQSAVQMSFFTCGAQYETFYDWDTIDFVLYVDSGNITTFEEVNYSGTPDVGYAFNATMPYAAVMDAGDHYFRVSCAPLSYETMLYVWNIYVLAVPTTIETGGVGPQGPPGENGLPGTSGGGVGWWGNWIRDALISLGENGRFWLGLIALLVGIMAICWVFLRDD